MVDLKQTKSNLINISINSAVKAVAIDGLLTFMYSYTSGKASSEAFYKTLISTSFSFISYEMRSMTREYIDEPGSSVNPYTYLSGIAGGIIKYGGINYFNGNPDSFKNAATMGAINNLGYEVSKDLKLNDNLQVVLLEGGESLTKLTILAASEDKSSLLKTIAQSLMDATAQAFIIEKVYVPFDSYIEELMNKAIINTAQTIGTCNFNDTNITDLY